MHAFFSGQYQCNTHREIDLMRALKFEICKDYKFAQNMDEVDNRYI